MEGPKELKEGLDFVIALTNCLGKSLADGKVDLSDALAFIPVLVKAPAAFSDLGKLPSELKELSPEDRGAILTYAKAQIDVPNDKIELYVEMALEVILQLGTLVAGLKK